jgi:hypothetical protein
MLGNETLNPFTGRYVRKAMKNPRPLSDLGPAITRKEKDD